MERFPRGSLPAAAFEALLAQPDSEVRETGSAGVQSGPRADARALDAAGDSHELDAAGEARALEVAGDVRALDAAGEARALDAAGDSHELDAAGDSHELDAAGEPPPTVLAQADTVARSPRSTCDLASTCPHCGTLMQPEHAHYRCLRCGYRDSCCF